MEKLEKEISFEYFRASGPGGQNVNKVSTAARLRFDAARSPSLSEEVRARLIRLAGKRVNAEGILLITAERFRTREENREDALARFYDLLRRASRRPKKRLATQPTKASQEERLKGKKKRGELKKMRRGELGI